MDNNNNIYSANAVPIVFIVSEDFFSETTIHIVEQDTFVLICNEISETNVSAN